MNTIYVDWGDLIVGRYWVYFPIISDRKKLHVGINWFETFTKVLIEWQLDWWLIWATKNWDVFPLYCKAMFVVGAFYLSFLLECGCIWLRFYWWIVSFYFTKNFKNFFDGAVYCYHWFSFYRWGVGCELNVFPLRSVVGVNFLGYVGQRVVRILCVSVQKK